MQSPSSVADQWQMIRPDFHRICNGSIYLLPQNGIVFIDEIDKIAEPRELSFGKDASSEGVQRGLVCEFVLMMMMMI